MGASIIKIDRLIAIVTILLQKEKTTAVELAEKFEVSRRTINRDIEDLCKAGIPIITAQGANGGISIMDSYKVEKTLFSDDELRAICVGLSSLDSVAKGKKYKNIIDKFVAQKDSPLLRNNVLIDLSSHYRETLAPKIELLQRCINSNKKLGFSYYSKNGQGNVVADPYLVIFQWSNWYFLGLDNASDSFKLYKLNRICHMEPIDESFELREIPAEKLSFNNYFTDEIQTVILFDQSEKYKLIDEYGIKSFVEQGDGRLRFSRSFTNADYLLSWVLSFGDKAEIIEPVELRSAILEQLKNASKKYCNDDI